MWDPISLVTKTLFKCYINLIRIYFLTEPMAGVDADDIVIPSVFIGQDGNNSYIGMFSLIITNTFFFLLRWTEN